MSYAVCLWVGPQTVVPDAEMVVQAPDASTALVLAMQHMNFLAIDEAIVFSLASPDDFLMVFTYALAASV